MRENIQFLVLHLSQNQFLIVSSVRWDREGGRGRVGGGGQGARVEKRNPAGF
jgi:hypothetical protein